MRVWETPPAVSTTRAPMAQVLLPRPVRCSLTQRLSLASLFKSRPLAAPSRETNRSTSPSLSTSPQATALPGTAGFVRSHRHAFEIAGAVADQHQVGLVVAGDVEVQEGVVVEVDPDHAAAVP